MSEFLLTFADHHPFLAFCFFWMVVSLLECPFKLVNRYYRSKNIKNAGWPPIYLDADGDTHLPEKKTP